MPTSLRDFRELVTKSLYFDARLLRMGEIPISRRVAFTLRKYRALLAIGAGRPTTLRFGDGLFHGSVVGDFGHLQSCLVDIHDHFFASNLVRTDQELLVLDAGANVGQWTCAFRYLFPASEIIAVEPDPDVFRELEVNVGGMPRVECVRCALAARDGTASLYRQRLSVSATLFPTLHEVDDNSIEVPVKSIDSLLDGRSVDFVKLRVQGAELEAVRGAEETLKQASVLAVQLSLALGPSNAIDTLAEIRRIRPSARIISFGRPFGPLHAPMNQYAVISLAG